MIIARDIALRETLKYQAHLDLTKSHPVGIENRRKSRVAWPPTAPTAGAPMSTTTLGPPSPNCASHGIYATIAPSLCCWLYPRKHSVGGIWYCIDPTDRKDRCSVIHYPSSSTSLHHRWITDQQGTKNATTSTREKEHAAEQ